MDLAQLYPWPEGPWLRTMMVMTLDGATVGPDGLSGSISGAADRRVFMEARRLADAVLVGAGTIRAERYRPMIAKPEWQEARTAAGLAPAPQIVVVSGALDLPWEEPMFAESTLPVIVATTLDADASRLARARAHAEIVQVGEGSVDVEALMGVLRDRGLEHITCEGGEALFDARVRAEMVDEMDLTISPVLAAAGHLPDPDLAIKEPYPRFSLAHQFTDEGFVFCRFVRE
ncbi:MAG: dihydrofolate reductase family protein [Candidatus Nanopelagicales bacterium]